MDQRIGELLGRIIPLSDHDVEEILNEQQAVGTKKFGDIALQLGLAKPEHILEAWLRQLETRIERVHLAHVGIDAQAVACLTAEVARRYNVVPIRGVASELILAVVDLPDPAAIAAIESAAGKRVKLVLADAVDVATAIARYYPAPVGVLPAAA